MTKPMKEQQPDLTVPQDPNAYIQQLRAKLEAVERESQAWKSYYEKNEQRLRGDIAGQNPGGQGHHTALYHITALQQQLVASQDQLEVAGLKAELLQEEVAELKQQLAAAQERLRALEAVERDKADLYKLYNTVVLEREQHYMALVASGQQLARAEQFLESQRTATYQAVEREHAAKKRLAQAQRETWEQAAQIVEGHTNPYSVHDCVEQDCKPWIAKELRQQATQEVDDE